MAIISARGHSLGSGSQLSIYSPRPRGVAVGRTHARVGCRVRARVRASVRPKAAGMVRLNMRPTCARSWPSTHMVPA